MIRDALTILLLLALAVAGLFLVAGCSPTGEMGKNLTNANELVTGLQRDIEGAEGAAREGRDPVPFCQAAKAKGKKLVKIIASVQRILPRVQDRPDPLSQMVTLARWAMIGLCGLLALYLGFGKVLRPVLNRFGLWLDRRLVKAAEMDVKLLAGQTTPAEVVAARRAADPKNEAAYRKAKKRQQKADSRRQTAAEGEQS